MSRWIVREGRERGRGRYLDCDVRDRLIWAESQDAALRYRTRDGAERDLARSGDIGRVVRLLSRDEAKQRAAAKARQEALSQVRALVLRLRMGATQDALGVLLGIVRDIDRAMCPCQGPLDDPGPNHVEACPYSDPDYGGDTCPF